MANANIVIANANIANNSNGLVSANSAIVVNSNLTVTALAGKVSTNDVTYTSTVARASSALQSITLTNTAAAAGVVSGSGGVWGIGTNVVASAAQTQQLYVATAGVVVGSQSNTISTAWRNPASATNWMWTSDGDSITLTNYTGPSDVVVPDTLDGRPVRSIAKSTFVESRTIAKVYLGVFLTNLNNQAFRLCTNLTYVSAPSLLTIEDGAFADCTSLTSMYIPKVTRVFPNVFDRCYSLVSVMFDGDAPAEEGSVFSFIPSNQVTNYVTNPTATGWGATWNSMPVVRMPIESERVNAGTVITIGDTSSGTFTLGGSTIASWPTGGSSTPLAWTPISTLATGAVITVTPERSRKIYMVDAAIPVTITNDTATLGANCTTNYEWEVWVNVLTTNATIVTHDARTEWTGLYSATPEITCTGLHKYAFSTACGTKIQGRQVYPTVYQWVNNMITVGASANTASYSFSPIASVMGVSGTNGYFYATTTDPTKYYTVKFGLAFSTAAAKAVLCTFAKTEISYGFSNIDLSYSWINVEPSSATAGVDSPLFVFPPATTVRAHNGFGFVVTRSTNEGSVYIRRFVTRQANELEIKAYDAGWRP